MPNPPRFTLPPALSQRVEALRAGATAGRPSRQAVVEAALGAGLGVLEGGGAAGARVDGTHPADAPTAPLAPAVARPLARALRAAGVDARARKGVVTVTAPAPWQPPPGDPRWALGGMGGPYARESHVVSDIRPGGKRVEVAVCAGDTLTVVRQALDAAWRARGEGVD